MTNSCQETLFSEFKKAFSNCPNFGSVSFVVHFHEGQVVRIERGSVESHKFEQEKAPIKVSTLETQEKKVTETPNRLFSKKEAATILRISSATLNRYMKNGEINVIRIGGRVLISKKEIDRLTNED
jgi:excisionase family DNA binding protein